MLTALLALALAHATPLLPQSQEDEIDARGVDKLRIEQEDKLLVPPDRVEEVWEYLRWRLVEDQAFLAELGPGFSASWSEELFYDTYFDTPVLDLHGMQSGLRHRRRYNLTNPEDAKSGRELVQLKMNAISDNPLERGEVKFEVERRRGKAPEDRHPLLGLVVEDQRELLTRRLTTLGLAPGRMRPILTLRDQRRRVYVLRDGKPFMSISHDRVAARVWWAEAEFCELEPELNEIGFTEADEATRAYMESVLQAVVADVTGAFPEIRRDLTPKYNKCFDRLEAELPFLRQVVRVGMQGQDFYHAGCGLVVVALAGAVGFLVLRLRARGRRLARSPEVPARAA